MEDPHLRRLYLILGVWRKARWLETTQSLGGRVRMGVSFLNSLPWSARRNRCLLEVPPDSDIQHHEIVSGERVHLNASQSIHKMSE